MLTKLQFPRIIIPHLIQIIPGMVAVVGILFLLLWFISSPREDLEKRVPGVDTTGLEVQPSHDVSAALRGKLIKYNGISVFDGAEPADLPGAWPRFLGRNFNGISDEEITLARKWNEGEPKELWAIDVGEGYASAAVLNGRVYVLDYAQEEQADALRCLSLADGKEIWRYSYPVKVKRNHGMSRTVPAVTDKYVVSLGPKCHVTCLDSTTGELHWMLDLVKDFGTKVPPWYAGQCPLIDGERAIIAPGGDALMIAVDCETGDIIWKTPNPHDWKMTHSSIIPMEFSAQAGHSTSKSRRMYVYCASGGVVGVSADDGSILWETTEWKISIATVPSPVIIGDGRIFLSGGYNAGSMMLQLKVKQTAGSLEDEGKLIAETLFRLKPEVFGSAQQTPIFFNGHIYGVRPDGQLVCLNLDGKLVWTSGSAHRFGLGPYLIADGLIYVMNDSGLLTLIEANSTGYKQLAQSQVLNGHDSWGPMAIAGGRLIVRDLTRMVCLDVK